jgi:hypothetical protein
MKCMHLPVVSVFVFFQRAQCGVAFGSACTYSFLPSLFSFEKVVLVCNKPYDSFLSKPIGQKKHGNPTIHVTSSFPDSYWLGPLILIFPISLFCGGPSFLLLRTASPGELPSPDARFSGFKEQGGGCVDHHTRTSAFPFPPPFTFYVTVHQPTKPTSRIHKFLKSYIGKRDTHWPMSRVPFIGLYTCADSGGSATLD